MSNYFENIVGRALNAVEVIQPRLPLLFESVSPAAPVLPPLLDAGTEPVHSVHSEEGLEQTASEDSIDATPSVKEQPANLAAHSAQASLQHPEAGKSVESPLGESKAAQFRRTVVGEVSEPPRQPRRVLTSTVEGAGLRRHEPLSNDPLLTRRRAESTERQPEEARDSGQRFPAQSQASTVPLVQTREQHFINSTQRVMADRAAAPRETPIVKVMIGRVDVRAIMPQAMPTRAAPPKPKPGLSLEDYLKQREEGKR
jgi:hypothetical protein